MESITVVLLIGYVNVITSWWWVMMGVVSVVGAIVLVLQNEDEYLSAVKALQLTVIGLVGVSLGFMRLPPLVSYLDFIARWRNVDAVNSFMSFALFLVFIAVILAPALLVVICVLKTICYFSSQKQRGVCSPRVPCQIIKLDFRNAK